MDRDIKIGIIVGIIVFGAIMLWSENTEYKQCLQAGAEATGDGYESYADMSQPGIATVWTVCSRNG